MPAVLNMSDALLAQGRDLFNAYRYDKALFLLKGLLRLPELKPAIAAEANFLVAQIHFRQNQLDRARTTLDQALAHDPEHADSHYLMGQVIESEEAGQTSDSIEHFEMAYRLAPKDARKQSAYALRMTRSGDDHQGLEILQGAYAEENSDPLVVSDFVEGLTHVARYDDAELVVKQASSRNHGDRRFAELRNRFEQQRKNDRLFGNGGYSETEPTILPFPSVCLPMNSPEQPLEDGKPGGSRKPTMPRNKPSRPLAASNKPVEASRASETRKQQLETISIAGDLTLSEVLRQFGAKYTARVYETLGLLGKTTPRAQASQITAALLQPAFMASLARRLPRASRKALKSVVQAGGFLPVKALFQNTGKDAPPADYIQPLVESGILYLGNDPKAKHQLVAVVPVDLLHRIAGVMRVRLDEADLA